MSVLLEAHDISISFGGIRAVQNLSFQIQRGEVLGLIGPNGAGKSTCINLITGVYMPDTGYITFDGTRMTEKHTIRERVHLGMGRTFQTPRPFGNMTVYDNVFTIALQQNSFAEAHAKAKEILEITDLAGNANMISAKLPIEMRKWLDLARILANNPKFIMMDEVMAGLNPNEMESSFQLIERLNQAGITILFIEHVMHAVVRVCSRVLVINEGKFLAEGEPREVLNRPEVVEAYIGGKRK